LLIEVSPPERLPSASRAGKPRLALDYLSPLDYERIALKMSLRSTPLRARG